MGVLGAIAGAAKRLVLGDVIVRRNPLYYGAIRRWQQRLDGDFEQRRALIARQLQIALEQASRTPYGRRIGAGTDLASWPLLEKPPLREAPADFFGPNAWLTGEASTSGTTGLQVPLRRSFQSMTVEQAYIDRVIEALGIPSRGARIAILRGENVKSAEDREPPFWIGSGHGRRLHFSCTHLGPDTIAHYARALREFAPQVLWVYPSNLEWLCTLLQRSGERLAVPCVLSSSEVLSPTMWQLARDVLGARVADYYGQAERVAFGAALEPGRFRFSPGYAYVELIPLTTAGGVTRHEIVGTTLWNAAMPLVRYRTGDFVELPESFGAIEREEIALGLRDIPGVLGRTVEYLVAPDGAILNSAGNLTKGLESIIRLQVLQPELDQVKVHVLVTPGFGARDLATLRQNSREAFPPTMTVDVDVVEQLHRTAVGKTPLVVHGAPVKAYLEKRAACSP
ncbi:MAG: hypothetical protein ABW136_04250 [Steroidobacteraceae bacterium]